MTRPPAPVFAPSRIRVSPDRRTLTLEFTTPDGGVLPPVSYDAEFLRVHSPSAEVRGHGAAERKIVSGKRGVRIASVEAIGSYAIRIGFDDGHDSGIYSWALFDSLHRDYDIIWNRYLAALAERKLSRDV